MEKEGKKTNLQYWGMMGTKAGQNEIKGANIHRQMLRVSSFYICTYKLTCTFTCTHICIYTCNIYLQHNLYKILNFIKFNIMVNTGTLFEIK